MYHPFRYTIFIIPESGKWPELAWTGEVGKHNIHTVLRHLGQPSSTFYQNAMEMKLSCVYSYSTLCQNQGVIVLVRMETTRVLCCVVQEGFPPCLIGLAERGYGSQVRYKWGVEGGTQINHPHGIDHTSLAYLVNKVLHWYMGNMPSF